VDDAAASAAPFIVEPAPGGREDCDGRVLLARKQLDAATLSFCADDFDGRSLAVLRAFAEFPGTVVNTRRSSSEVFTMRDFCDRRSFDREPTRRSRLRRGVRCDQ